MGHDHRIVNLTQHQVITPMETGGLEQARRTYREAAGRVTRADPPWRARAISHLDAG